MGKTNVSRYFKNVNLNDLKTNKYFIWSYNKYLNNYLESYIRYNLNTRCFLL